MHAADVVLDVPAVGNAQDHSFAIDPREVDSGGSHQGDGAAQYAVTQPRANKGRKAVKLADAAGEAAFGHGR
ncbi:MAG: hypothetical protein ACOVKS_00775 [Aquimonas sp.]